MKKTLLFIILALAIFSGLCSQNHKEYSNKLSDLFKGHTGCFVLYNQNENSYYHFNDSICDTRYAPMSTFKVPNSLFALDAEILQDENSIIEWDSIQNPAQSWWSSLEWDRGQTLQTAFEHSVVWAYQDIAHRIGREKYENYLKRIQYGNQSVGEKVDWFWLDGSLQISANEQIEFLKSFYYNKFEFSQSTINTVKKIFIRKETENYRLSFKTGGGDLNTNKFIGWLIGYVEKDNNTYFFAMNVLTEDINSAFKLRMDISLAFLRFINLID